MDEIVSLIKRIWASKEIKPMISAIKLGFYVLLYISLEGVAHFIQTLTQLGLIPTVGTHILAIISLAAAVIEASELAFGIEIKTKISEGFDEIWKKALSWIKGDNK